MDDNWEKQLACADQCTKCQSLLGTKDKRILSVYNHQPICMACKQKEETQSDYEDTSRGMVAACIEKTNKPYGDPASYCFHHFCPFTCKQ